MCVRVCVHLRLQNEACVCLCTYCRVKIPPQIEEGGHYVDGGRKCGGQ